MDESWILRGGKFWTNPSPAHEYFGRPTYFSPDRLYFQNIPPKRAKKVALKKAKIAEPKSLLLAASQIWTASLRWYDRLGRMSVMSPFTLCTAITNSNDDIIVYREKAIPLKHPVVAPLLQ